MASIWEQITGTAEDAFNAGKEWAGDVVDDVKGAATNFAIDQVIDNMKDQYSFKDAFVTYDKLTPELEAAGWKEGLDGQPYNAQLAIDFAPGGKFYDPDVDKNVAMAQAAANAGITNSPVPSTNPFLSQDLRQRTPSGTIYNPSMEAFDNASLFNYEGPGGAAEYTYGQGLPIGYGTYGTPVGPNLYYEGQFGEGYREPQVADNAINLPPVAMPGGIPQIPTERPTQANMPGFTSGGGGTGPGGKDLTYQETIDYFGLDPVSTTFPSPGAELVDTPASVLNVGLPDFLSDAWTGVKDFGSDLIGGLFADDGVEETAAAPSGVEINQAMPEFLNQGWPAGAQSGGSGIKYVDMGNNPDVGNLYTDPADRQLANEVLGGEAYARAVYNNDPIAQAIPGMADKNIAGFNLGRPQTKAQREMMSNVPDMFKVEAPSIFSEPGGPPASTTGNTYVGANATPFESDNLFVSAGTKSNPPSTNVYVTSDRNTGQIVTVDKNKGTVTPTPHYMRFGR